MMKWAVLALALMASPAAAQDCFAGEPRKVSYDNGRVFTIIQRHGADVTYTVPYEGFQDSVSKTHLMLIPKQGRSGARSSEYKWSSRLPKLRDLVPGYTFDIKGTMKSGEGEAVPYRITGEVLREEVVKVGACSYPTLVILVETYLRDLKIFQTTDYLSPDMVVLLKAESILLENGQITDYAAVGLD
jgi:hypothetical protein